jgi:hypothetical protein
VLAAKDPEWFEKIDSITPADIIAVATEFTKQTVDKVQHGKQQPLFQPNSSRPAAPAHQMLHTIYQR